MSGWGAPLVVDGVTMVPLVGGATWALPGLADPVEVIIISNRETGGAEHSLQVLNEATSRHIGQPYSHWLDRLYIGGAQRLEFLAAE